MKPLVLLTILLATSICYAQPISYEWGNDLYTDNNWGIEPYGICVDLNGNSFVYGRYGGSADFSTDATPVLHTSQGVMDHFVLKYSPNGELEWVRFFQNTGGDMFIYDIEADQQGNVFLVGQYNGTIQLKIGSGPSDFRSSVGQTDIFLLKLSSDGNSEWSKSFGGGNADLARSLTIDGENNIILSGSAHTDVEVEYDADATGFLVLSESQQILCIKIDPFGNTQWIRTYGTSNIGTEGRVITTDNDNNVYLGGTFRGDIYFPDILHLAQGIDFGDVIIFKFSPSGELLKVIDYGGDGYDYLRSIQVDGFGNIYTSGSNQYSIDLDPSAVTQLFQPHEFIQKLDADGNFLWGKSYSSMDLLNLKLDNYDHPVISANLYNTEFFVSGSGFNTPGDGPDLLVARMGVDGSFFWAKNTGADIYGHQVSQAGLAIDVNDNILITGYSNMSMDMDPTIGVDMSISSSGSGRGCYTIKISDASTELFENESSTSFTVSPNPTAGNIELYSIEEGYLEIFNSTLQKVSGSNVSIGVNNVDLPQLDGLYFLKLSSGDKVECIKVIRN
jgi:hypothetical protein